MKIERPIIPLFQEVLGRGILVHIFIYELCYLSADEISTIITSGNNNLLLLCVFNNISNNHLTYMFLRY